MGKKSLGRPTSHITPSFYVREPDPVMKALTRLKNGGFTWQELADYLKQYRPNISRSTVWRVTKGIMKSDEIEIALGFKEPPKSAPIVIMSCAVCGEAHTVDWCVHIDGQPKRPKSKNSRRVRRPRFSAAADDPEMAMRQLERYYPGLFSLNVRENDNN